MKRIRVAIATVGCRANQADSAALLRHLDNRVVSIVSDYDLADFVVVNTCCVTREAERDCRKTTRRALRASENAHVLLLGCAVNAFPEFGIDLGSRVFKFRGKDGHPAEVAAWIQSQGLDLIRDRSPEDAEPISPRILGRDQKPEDAEPISPRILGRTRALVKVQNGCSHHCSYCIVPRARGKETSVPLESVKREVERLLADGFSEIVLTGVQLGAWGVDLPGKPVLPQLVAAVADMVRGGRIRLSSIEPWSVDRDLIETVSSHPRVCAHFHVPLQNGDDGILRAMGRGYTAREYLEIVDIIREILPEAALGTDVLLGFPGETEQAFRNTLDLLHQIKPSYVHAFSYSPRPGTRAAQMSGRPSPQETRNRTRRVREVGAEYAEQFRSSQLGRVRETIVEDVSDAGAQGLTDNFIGVQFLGDTPPPGSLVRARLVENPFGTDRLGAVVSH